MKYSFSILTFLYLISLCTCTEKIAGTETTNGDEVIVTAGVNNIRGIGPVGAEIQLFSEGYYPFIDSGFTFSTTISDERTFQFSNLVPGNYNILCTQVTADRSVFAQQISVQAMDHYNTDTVFLNNTGTIKGALIDSLNNPLKSAYAYIKGSPFFATTNNLGEYELAKIPDGLYTVIFARTDRNSTWIKGPPVSVSVTVTAGKATEVEPVTYK